MLVRRIHQHGSRAGRQSLAEGPCPWDVNRDVGPPLLASEPNRLRRFLAIAAIGDEAVLRHVPTEQLDCCMFFRLGQRSDLRGMRRFGDDAALWKVRGL